MGAEIFEICGKGLGGEVMCHLVAIGAHDGRQGVMGSNVQLRKAKPNQGRQYKSWFRSAWPYVIDGHPLVGEIYFPFANNSLDYTSDRPCLDAVAAWYRFELQQGNKVELTFVGHADPRGAAGFNEVLGQRRAEAVQRYVDNKIRTNFVERVTFRYKSKAISRGETEATGDHAADRRVDILLSSVLIKEHHGFDAKEDAPLITGDYKGPLTSKLLFRSWGGAGGSVVVVAAEVAEVEVKNPKTGVTAFYQYTGGGLSAGAPISASEPSKNYVEWEVPFALVDVDDFAGPGGITTAGVGATGSCYLFNGPKMHRVKKLLKNEKGVEVCDSGLALNAGVSMTGGKWRRMPYRTAKERDDYLASRGKKDKELEPYRPPL